MEQPTYYPKFPMDRVGLSDEFDVSMVPFEAAAGQFSVLRQNMERDEFSAYIEDVSKIAQSHLSDKPDSRDLTAYSLLARTWAIGQEIDDQITRERAIHTGTKLIEPIFSSIKPTLHQLEQQGITYQDDDFYENYDYFVSFCIESRARKTLAEQDSLAPSKPRLVAKPETKKPSRTVASREDVVRGGFEVVRRRANARKLYRHLQQFSFDEISRVANKNTDLVQILEETDSEQYQAIRANLLPVIELEGIPNKQLLYPEKKPRWALRQLFESEEKFVPPSEYDFDKLPYKLNEDTFNGLVWDGWLAIAEFKKVYSLDDSGSSEASAS